MGAFLGFGQGWGKQFKASIRVLHWFLVGNYFAPIIAWLPVLRRHQGKSEGIWLYSSLKVFCLKHALFLTVRKNKSGTKICFMSYHYKFYANVLDIHYHSNTLLNFWSLSLSCSFLTSSSFKHLIFDPSQLLTNFLTTHTGSTEMEGWEMLPTLCYGNEGKLFLAN